MIDIELSEEKPNPELSNIDSGQTSTHNEETYNGGSESDEFLRATAHGIMGVLERIPLHIKLILMLLASIIGLVVFAVLLLVDKGQELKRSRDIDSFVSGTTALGQYISHIQNEREWSSLVLGFGDDLNNRHQLFLARAEVDEFHKKFFTRNVQQLEQRFGSQMKNVFNTIKMHYQDETIWRTVATSNDPSNLPNLFNYYRNYISDLITAASSISRLAELDAASVNYVTMLKAVEAQVQMKNYGLLMFRSNMVTNTGFKAFIGARNQRDVLVKVWTDNASPDLVKYFEQVVAPLAPVHTNMTNWIENTVNLLAPLDGRYNMEEWNSQFNSIVAVSKLVQGRLAGDIKRNSKRNFKTAMTVIIIYSLLVLIFSVISLITAFLLSYTIISPWRRLNRIQELAISKFVPKGFLKLLGASNIAEVNPGKYVQRELTLMEVDITDFESISKTMKHEHIFAYLNEYLTYVGDVIRRHGGFIDKHFGNRFTVVFPDAERGLKSCIEIQNAIDSFNSLVLDKYPRTSIVASIHTGSVLIGSVGENERMAGVLLSEHVQINERLERMSKRFNARLLTTKDSLEKCGKWIRHVQYRLLGTISMKNQSLADKSSYIQVFEILHKSDPSAALKSLTSDTFKKAVDEYEKGSYMKAITLFAAVIEKDPTDISATLYLARAEQLLTQCKYISTSLSLREVLTDVKLLEGFKLFCREERSTENLSLWLLIEQDFKTIQRQFDQIEFAHKICRDYFSLSGSMTININEKLKKKVVEKLTQPSVISSSLFDEVQSELEMIMKDTLQRYVKSSTFLEYLLHSDKCPQKPPLLDEL